MYSLHAKVIQAPMAGGAATPELASAVCNAGGLGFLAAGYKSAAKVREEINELRNKTNQPFGINLFMPSLDRMDEERINTYRDLVSRSEGVELGTYYQDDDGYREKLDLLIKENVPIASFTFGCPAKEDVDELHRYDIFVIVTVTNAEEMDIALESNADAVCIQGSEAGGHRGTFRNENENTNMPILTLISSLRPKTDKPIIAAGGIMDGVQMKMLLDEGADAVQLGTAFLCCPESGAHPMHKEAIMNNRYDGTVLTRAFSGRLARGLRNSFIDRYGEKAPASYPFINQITQPLRKKSAVEGNPENMSLWAGVGYAECRGLPAGELVSAMLHESGVIK
ncbi:NAD(P)H-dependent flavin oxidoreductase [Bacillus sp. 1P06AnD]|uniref:NAD(P)H-dependent flavin oxidoreductase n=1 Tax=Bacillus sp. 1P06AnD TaxID=3132208 RepID=UPI0039A04EF5